MKKIILLSIAVFIIIVGSYFGYLQYEDKKFSDLIVPHVKNSSLRVANAIRFEGDTETKITFKEIFEKLETDVSEIDKRILEVQTIATPKHKEYADAVVAYMKGSQELLRSILSKYRKKLASSTARDRVNREEEDLRRSNYYSRDMALKESVKALEDYLKVLKEYEAARLDVLSSSEKLKSGREILIAKVPADILVDPAIFEVIEKNNELKK